MFVASGQPQEIYWSHGGRHLAYTRWQGDHNEWWLIPNVTEGGVPVRLTQGTCWDFTWSTDADWALWRTGNGADGKLHTCNVARASTDLLLAEDVAGLLWSNDGARLAVLTADETEVVAFAKQGNVLVELARLRSTTGAFASWFYWQPVPR